jgi:glutathione S-transferase
VTFFGFEIFDDHPFFRFDSFDQTTMGKRNSPALFFTFLALLSSESITMALSNTNPAVTRLVTHKSCPFAQKAWIALECSEQPYELEEISLYGSGGKPSWFLQLNPSGKVPVLVCDGGPVVLPDSDLILDAIERGSVPTVDLLLLPEDDPSLAESVKAWRSSINEMLPVGKKAVLSGATAPLLKLLRDMDANVVGPYLVGDHVTMADCHAFPFLWRIETEFGLADYPKIQSWLDNCSQQPAFQKTIQPSWWWWW